MRSRLLAAGLACATVVSGCATAGPQPDPRPAARAHAAALVIDGHVATAQRLADEAYDLAAPPRDGQVSLDGLAAGNVGAVFFAVGADSAAYREDARGRALAQMRAVREQVARHPDRLALARTADEVLAARRSGRIAVLLALEGGEPLGKDPRALAAYRELGVVSIGLAEREHSAYADSATPLASGNGGLTRLGRVAVVEANRLGVVIDVSHLSDAAAADAVRASHAPVIASHTSARALAELPRSAPDELLREIAERGGVVLVTFHAALLDVGYGMRLRDRYGPELRSIAARRAERGPEETSRAFHALNARAAAELPRPSLQVLLDHLEHVARVAGIEHVGLGSDFDAGIVPPAGLGSQADLPRITAGLLQRGFTEADVARILGGNLLRVLRDVERIGAALRSDQLVGPLPPAPPGGSSASVAPAVPDA